MTDSSAEKPRQPYDPSRDYVPYKNVLSAQEKGRQIAQVKVSPRDRRRRLAHTKGEG